MVGGTCPVSPPDPGSHVPGAPFILLPWADLWARALPPPLLVTRFELWLSRLFAACGAWGAWSAWWGGLGPGRGLPEDRSSGGCEGPREALSPSSYERAAAAASIWESRVTHWGRATATHPPVVPRQPVLALTLRGPPAEMPSPHSALTSHRAPAQPSRPLRLATWTDPL